MLSTGLTSVSSERPAQDPLESDIFKPLDLPIKCTRDRVVKEILTTEQTYVRSLHAMTQAFKDPIARRIEEGSLSLTEANFHVIFSNVEEIIQVAFVFLS